MPPFHYINGSLHAEEIDLAHIAATVGTPAYIYSATAIRHHFQRFQQAFSSLDHLICYAAKANSNLAILRLLAKEGAGFDIVSGGELFKVLRAGGRADQCTFAGVGKLPHEIEYALQQGIACFNVESEQELEVINDVAARLGCIAPIALRINPDVDAPTHRYISTGKSKNKFGIGLDRAERVYAQAATLSHLKIRGLQTHIGSQILDATPFATAVEKLTPLVLKIKKQYDLEFFSLGGGIGIPYQNVLKNGEQELTPEKYAAQVLEPLRALGLRILFEPGRFLVGNAGVLLTTALYRKETPAKKFLIVDAGMNDLIRPALYQGYHEIVPLQQQDDRALEEIDVVGPVCESGDFFAEDRSLPHIEPGELLAILSAGAYGFTMGSNYNARPMPPEVLVEGKTMRVVRKRQTYEDLVRGEELQ
jgi:diaminopimelate decarboxylase